jgi:hypothetical protein
MEFEKVRKEHILKAIKDYQEKGLPKGFGPSSTYDIIKTNHTRQKLSWLMQTTM